ncbi:HipA domain-containing protein [Cupriavidus sp. D39]|uniref:HipA domain-containing protein n=1 Tax=Cupriavidus sp. D39 TaxID=2997877 RepID=UPI00226F999F|nr:HipA domain-containing protein [Cupriavidus sp. D39]MCY0855248.1 HipA domain-containing protein [Cupriavidus sp. D39]
MQSNQDSARRLFARLLVNYALRNADAHLKNFAVVYISVEEVRLAPVCNIVTVTAYREYQARRISRGCRWQASGPGHPGREIGIRPAKRRSRPFRAW